MKRVPKGYYETPEGKEYARSLAAKFDSKTKFRRTHAPAALAAVKLGYFDEITAHMPKMTSKPSYWKTDKGIKEAHAKAQQCETKSELKEKHRKMVDAIWKANPDLYNKITAHMPERIVNASKWRTPEGIEEAKAIIRDWEGSVTELSKEVHHQMCSILIEEIGLDEWYEITSHLRAQRIKGYWKSEEGYQEAKELAARYEHPSQFTKNHPNASNGAREHGYYAEITAHMTMMQRPVGYWDTPEGRQEMIDEAAKYDEYFEFRDQSNQAYMAAKARGLIDELGPHLSRRQKPNGYWTSSEGIQEAHDSAKTVNTNSEFKAKFPAAHSGAFIGGYLQELADLYWEQVQRPMGWWKSQNGKQEAIEAIAKFDNLTDFREAHYDIYTAIVKEPYYKEIAGHLDRRTREGYYETEEGFNAALESAMKCSSVSDFREKFGAHHSGIYKLGLIPEVADLCGWDYSVSKPKGYYETDEGFSDIKVSAELCETKIQHRLEFPKEHSAAHRLGLLDKVGSHWIEFYRDLTEEEVWETGRKVKTRSEFFREHGSIANKARDLGILQEVLAHLDYQEGGGFRGKEPGILYVIGVHTPLGYIPKIGISNTSVEVRFRTEKAEYDTLAVWDFEVGYNARDAETLIKRMFKEHSYDGSEVLTSHGHSEMFKVEVSKFLETVKQVAEDYGGVR